ncbi:MAG: hypothetical protein QXT64_08745 [Desulfurococcaceae archaeon]
MPSRQMHELFDKLFFNKKHSKVHKLLDLPSSFLGTKHRTILHDELQALLLGYVIDGPEGALSALLHIWLDKNFK